MDAQAQKGPKNHLHKLLLQWVHSASQDSVESVTNAFNCDAQPSHLSLAIA